jgi:2,3-dihydroxyphenylpropionate 1,2-dioxygenase
MDPSWHHNYASLGWWSPPSSEAPRLHYPSIAPELVHLTEALHRLANDAGARRRYAADRVAFCGECGVSGEQAAALAAMDTQALTALGVHPLLAFLANLHLGRKES